MSAMTSVQLRDAIGDWSLYSKHKVPELMSDIGSVQPRGAVDDWSSCSKHSRLELCSAIGPCCKHHV